MEQYTLHHAFPQMGHHARSHEWPMQPGHDYPISETISGWMLLIEVIEGSLFSNILPPSLTFRD